MPEVFIMPATRTRIYGDSRVEWHFPAAASLKREQLKSREISTRPLNELILLFAWENSNKYKFQLGVRIISRYNVFFLPRLIFLDFLPFKMK